MQNQYKRGAQHDDADGRRGCVIVLLQLDDDQQRRDFGNRGQIAGNEDYRTVFAHGARECQGRAGDQRRHQRGQHDAPNGLKSRRAQCGGGFFGFLTEFHHHRLHGAHDEGQADKRQRDDNAQRRVGNLDAEMTERRAKPALRRVEGRQRNTGNGGGQSKGQVDQRVDQTFAWEAIADQNPGGDGPESSVDRGGDGRGAE